MAKKNNYPKDRKPVVPVQCPHCYRTIQARGIVNHLKLAHGVAYTEIEKYVTLSGTAMTPQEENLETQKAALNRELEAMKESLHKCYEKGERIEVAQLIEKIEKQLYLLGWPGGEIKTEVERYRYKFELSGRKEEHLMPNLKKRVAKRLVLMFDDNSFREVNANDYLEVLEIAYFLDTLMDKYNERLKLKELPIRLSIGSALGNA